MMNATYAELSSIYDDLCALDAPSREMDLRISKALLGFPSRALITRDQTAAVNLIKEVLPGWWWKCGSCFVSDDACIAPDYNDPVHGERLAREFPLPSKRYDDGDGLTWGPLNDGFDVDRRPPGNVAIALLESLFMALIFIEGQKH